MSRGLGIAQRQLLGALYVATASNTFPTWRLRPAAKGPIGAERVWQPDESDEHQFFYAVVQLHLAEGRDPQLRNTPPYSIRDYHDMRPDDDQSTLEERNIRRSWRALYRRAADGLVTRGLIDTVPAVVTLEDLDVPTYWSWFRQGAEPTCTILLARITDAGARYAEQHRADLVNDTSILNDELRRVFRDKGFVDVAEPPKRSSRRRRRRRRSRPSRSNSKPIAAEPAEPIRQPTKRDEVIAQLASEGFDADTVGAAVRAWHRAEQRESRRQFGDNGTPLYAYIFQPNDIEELRRRLSS